MTVYLDAVLVGSRAVLDGEQKQLRCSLSALCVLPVI